jgi:adenosylhomocysteine nucleosidase
MRPETSVLVTLPVLAVSGLAKEMRLAAGPGVEAVGAGGNPERLTRLLDARTAPGCRAVVSFGIAGGLDPALRPGDVVIATGIISLAGRFESDPVMVASLAQSLSGAGLRLVQATLAGADAAVLGVAEKSDLRRASGAAAVDMESHVAAAFAGRHRLPFVALRIVCDPAERALPAFAAAALTPEGEPDIRAVLGALVRGRARIGELIRLGRDSSAAFAALARCRRALGPGLGLPDHT